MKRVIVMFLAIGGASACATVPVPSQALAASEANARAAEAVGAQQHPQAAYHLHLAREQIAEAQSLIRDGDNLRAHFVLRRAAADGELAMALAREADARAAADRARAEMQQIQEQLPE